MSIHPYDRPKKAKTLLVTKSVRERKRTTVNKKLRMSILLYVFATIALVAVGATFWREFVGLLGPRRTPIMVNSSGPAR